MRPKRRAASSRIVIPNPGRSLVTSLRGEYSILHRFRRTGKRRAHHFDGHLPVPGRSLAGVRRDAHRRAAAVGGFLHHQRQPALDPRLARRRSGRAAARGLRLRRQLRRVPDHRRAARRPVWPPPAVPDRHGRLPRHQHAVRPRRHAVAARDRPRPAGHLGRHDGAAGARLDPRRCSRATPNSPGRSASMA